MAERRLDPDRLTAIAAVPIADRPAFKALWDLDLTFADVVGTSSQPALGAIRMAWWRERLQELDRSAGVPAEPRLQDARKHLVQRGIAGAELSMLEDAWLPLLEPFPWTAAAAEGLRLRGRILFNAGARLLGGAAADAEPAGVLWSLVNGAQFCSDADSRTFLVGEARTSIADIPDRSPAAIRPLTVLAALAAYDLRPGGRLGRVGVAFAHRLRGTISRG